MSALQEFVNQQKAKGALGGNIVPSQILPYVSLGELKSKISSKVSALPLFSHFNKNSTDDDQSLMKTSSENGQLPHEKNRKNGSFSDDETVFGLSRIQRIVVFAMFFLGGLFCFGTAIVFFPVIVLQARKFAALNTLGSVLLIFSFAFLWGPLSYVRHTFSEQRRYVTISYLITLILTLYSSLWLQSTLLTIVFAFIQAIALLWYVLSYVPGGERGLRLFNGIFKQFLFSKSKTVLPV